MSVPVDHRMARIADRQQINITRAQLIKLGLTDDGIRYRRDKGNLYLVHHGVYSVGRPPRTGPEKACAAVLACGDRAVLADEAAAAAWGFRKWPHPPYMVFVDTGRQPKGINARRIKLDRKDIRRHLGMRITSPARAALDLAARLPDQQLKRAIDEARLSRTARLTLDQLRDVADRYPRHPGAKKLKAFIAAAPKEPNRSGFEDEFHDYAVEFDFPEYVTNRVMFGHRVDVYFVNERLALELDGWITHSDQYSHEENTDRDETLLEHRIPTVRITRKRYAQNRAGEAMRLHRILQNRRLELAAEQRRLDAA
jgi:very-short-patch-repair endonuclease